MTPEDTARAVKPAVVGLGAAFGHEPSFAVHGQRLGLGRWPFYFGGRAGVLGSVDADVVTAACGFFAPGFVRSAWQQVLATGRLDEVVRLDVQLCVEWARGHFTAPDVARVAELTGKAVAGADPAGRVLFAAWRAMPDPAEDPAAVLGLNLLRLREHRGGSHLLAVVGEGLTPLEAILAGPGAGKAEANGWRPPFPDAPANARLAAAERRTDELAGSAYAALAPGERAELVDLLGRLSA